MCHGARTGSAARGRVSAVGPRTGGARESALRCGIYPVLRGGRLVQSRLGRRPFDVLGRTTSRLTRQGRGESAIGRGSSCFRRIGASVSAIVVVGLGCASSAVAASPWKVVP